MTKNKKHQELTAEEYTALFERIGASNLSKADQATIIAEIKAGFNYGLNMPSFAIDPDLFAPVDFDFGKFDE